MINPADVCLFIPPGLRNFKHELFERIGRKIEGCGGRVLRYDYSAVPKLRDSVIPIVGVSPQFRSAYVDWLTRDRPFIYWDRGYLRRVFATHLATGNQMGVAGGYYRWHYKEFQMTKIRDVPPDRWDFLRIPRKGGDPGIEVQPWKKNGHRIVIADTGSDYWDVFADRGWTARTAEYLRSITKRPVFVRSKESKVPLAEELRDAHCLVAHGSIAAVEAVVLGCPVFVHAFSAAALVGRTDFSAIEEPYYPDRDAWLRSLAYSQFNETELVDGTLWRLLE